MKPLSVLSRLGVFSYKHLLLIDLHSAGMSFYLAKDVKELSAIDFAHLTLLKSLSCQNLCQRNLLANLKHCQESLQSQLQAFDLKQYALIFLISPNHSVLEKKALLSLTPIFKTVTLIERHYFYNFYLMQKRNFSKIKFLINMFDDCAELSLFDQDQLLAHQNTALHNFVMQSQDFFTSQQKQLAFARPDCFYFFTNNVTHPVENADLVKALQLEAIEIDQLC